MTTHDFTALPDLASRALGGSCVRGERRTVRAAGEPHPARSSVLRPERIRSQGQGVRRMGNPSPPRRRSRLRHRTARHTGNHPRNHRRHCVFQGQLPTVRLDRGGLDRGLSLHRGGHEGRLADHRREVPGRRVTPPTPTRSPTGTGGLTCDSRSIPTVASRGCAYTARWYRDPRFLDGTMDLLAAENGGRLVGCSDAFYASPANIILPGRARNMGEGWENARRRGGGNDFAVFALAAAGRPRNVEIDTSYYVGNAPGWVRLSAIDARSADIDDDSAWTELLPRTAVQPDTRHRFVLRRRRRRHTFTARRLPRRRTVAPAPVRRPRRAGPVRRPPDVVGRPAAKSPGADRRSGAPLVRPRTNKEHQMSNPSPGYSITVREVAGKGGESDV